MYSDLLFMWRKQFCNISAKKFASLFCLLLSYKEVGGGEVKSKNIWSAAGRQNFF